jgi:peptidyl-prolyl cis-trans isomerase D
MFNLFLRREKATRYLLGGVMVILAASMLTYLTQTGLTSADGSATLAQVGPNQVTMQEVQTMVDRGIRAGQISPNTLDLMLPTFVDQLLQQRAAIYAFGELGLKVSDEEVLAGIMSIYPQFFTNGKLTQKDQLEQQLGASGLTLAEAVDGMREQLLMKKLQNMVYSTVVVTPQEVDDYILKKHQKAKISYVAFPAAKFREDVKPTPEQVRQFYDANKASFSAPAKRSFQVVVVDQLRVEKTITVSDAQLHAAYSASMDNFRTPERAKVRHILLMTQGKSDADKKAALTKAQGILKQLRGGADFADIAKKNSEDPGTAPKGGDLGYIVRGQTVPEFEKTAFSAKINDISDIVTTEYGYHIIQVQERQPARVVPFEEVKDKIAEELKKQNVGEKMQMLADQAHAALVKSPGSALEVAKQFGLELITATTASGQPIPDLGVSPEIDGALSVMKPKEASGILTLPSNRLAIVVLNELIPSKPAEFSEVQNQIRDTLILRDAQGRATAEAQKFSEKLRAGADFDTLAKADKFDVVKSEFGPNDSVEGLGPANNLIEAFTRPVGTVLGPGAISGRDVVYQVTGHIAPDIKDYANERQTELDQLKKDRAKDQYDLMMDSIMAQLRADKKVVVNQDNLKKLAASYRQNR